MFFEIILIFYGAVCACLHQTSDILEHTFGCFDSGDTELSVTLDGDEIYYADYKEGKVVWDSRVPSPLLVPYAYHYAEFYKAWCLGFRRWWETGANVEEAKDAPETSIYSKHEVTREVENTLICFVDNFFPPSIKVKWSKNVVEVAVEDPVISYLANLDGTFRHISTLNILPQEGDVYACTVEHKALQEPQTTVWEPDLTESISGPTVFCGVGLVLGLLGVATGTFLFVKGRHLE